VICNSCLFSYIYFFSFKEFVEQVYHPRTEACLMHNLKGDILPDLGSICRHFNWTKPPKQLLIIFGLGYYICTNLFN
jgi:hypothetical protein